MLHKTRLSQLALQGSSEKKGLFMPAMPKEDSCFAAGLTGHQSASFEFHLGVKGGKWGIQKGRPQPNTCCLLSEVGNGLECMCMV